MSDSTRIGEAGSGEVAVSGAAKPNVLTARTQAQDTGEFQDRLTADLADVQDGQRVSDLRRKTVFPTAQVVLPARDGQRVPALVHPPATLPKNVSNTDSTDALGKSAEPSEDHETSGSLAEGPVSGSDKSATIDFVGPIRSDATAASSQKIVNVVGSPATLTASRKDDTASVTKHLLGKSKTGVDQGLAKDSTTDSEAVTTPGPVAPVAPADVVVTTFSQSKVSQALQGGVSIEKTAVRTSQPKTGTKNPQRPEGNALAVAAEPVGSSAASQEPGIALREGADSSNAPGLQATKSLEGLQDVVAKGTNAGTPPPVHVTGASNTPHLSSFRDDGVASLPEGVRDGARSESESHTFVATPRVLEVGIANGTYGWLRVRAELGKTGELNGVVVANSTVGASTLRGELSGITSFLRGEDIDLSSLVVQSASKGADAHASGLNTATDGQAQQSGYREDPRSQTNSQPGAAPEGSSQTSLWPGIAPERTRTGISSSDLAHGMGGWLSVRV